MKHFAILLLASVFLVACAGRDPNPVQVKQAGDNNLSCSQLESKILSAQQSVQRLEIERSKRNRHNIGWGIAAAFLLLPAFALDISNGVDVDLSASYERRYHLEQLAAKKNC